MTYIRGIWLFGNAIKEGILELILSKRFKSVENRVKKLLEEEYVDIPNDKDILEWFKFRVLCENVAEFTAAKLPSIFKKSSSGVFTIDNLKTSTINEKDQVDQKTIINISENNLIHYMNVSEGKYLWPFMYSYSNGYFILILISLETSISEDPEILRIYKKGSRNRINDLDNLTLKLVEFRVGIQLLEDLFELLGINQEGEMLEVSHILEVWRIFMPFGCPMMDKKEVKDLISISENKGIPNYLASLLKDNSIESSKIQEKLKSINNEQNQENKKNESILHGSFYLDSISKLSNEEEQQLIQEMDATLSLNDEYIPIIPSNIPNNQIIFGEMLNIGIGKLSFKAKSSNDQSSLNYSMKFTLIETICCFAKKHPMITQIENGDSITEGEDSMSNFIKKIGDPYASFTSGALEFFGKLPNSVSISCNVILPWQKVTLESNYENDQEVIYIQPYISVKDNISCTKLNDELFDSNQKTFTPIRHNSEIYMPSNESSTPISRFKLSWNSSQSNSSKIFTYWYPYELDIPIKGYFTISPESKEPIKQITQSQGHFRPILTHSFQMEYCLCFDPAIVKGMQVCQVSIPLLPGTLESINNSGNNSSFSKQNIPSVMIFSHTLKSSMGQIIISNDKKHIIWTINNPKEVLGKNGLNKKFSFIQLRMYGSIKLRIIYKENKYNRTGNNFSSLQGQAFNSPAINSYLLNIGLETGIPSYSQKFLEKINSNKYNEFLYSAPDPFGAGIQPFLNCPIKEIDPIWLIELHPKIAKFSENSKKLTQKEIYSNLVELIFPYSLLNFTVCSTETTYRGVNIPPSFININPKALQFEQPEIYSNSGKYIIWRNT
ncbi:hypothetical protein [Cryptosporidium parvum Iowa II]|uniref:Uncharacterized protein n=2 Tax=Cryptosporidium parvum TaxID=5807 RepID=Q5CPR2_CRYPI|nr:hypothetical protein [Cryptosporidium parvum Iowa II]EAK87411.1 hypothetical protein cgd4_4370 [Cryptosporidium parvum Iowa II]QOY42333.1 Uncharacterized protein CPATCC_0021640 [Cryptosporidium parvum]WKS77636.1 hypothetical protein CPCDC_4g4370 [Cryptosporidium sp. 43IA8]WRK31691.1 Uncharacterized protein cpbgf_4004370 [Cryptosporidium parvum]|eukprot:QOY42333.1 hypothetical protein CPATCC_001967 [Cryptosporidium parvum]